MSAHRRPPTASSDPPADRGTPTPLAAAALDVQAALLSQPRQASAAAAWARALAQAGPLDRVTLAVQVDGNCRLIATSTGPLADLPAADADALRLALGEALDQAASIAWPDGRVGQQPRISLAQQRLLGARTGSVASVPLVRSGRVLGAMCAERHDRPLAAAEIDALEHLACLAAPVLDLMQLNERPWPQRLRDAWRDWRAGLDAPARRRRLALLAVGAAGLALWPMAWHVGGHARLEGAVQRVLVAPTDGFLRQVHARPGETVHTGQLLVELAEQDLQLEQQRWQSQLAQHENAYAAANARADRAQQVIQQSRAAEAEAQLGLVQMKLARGRIEAPFDGLVVQGDLSQSLGAPLAQGAELMTIAPTDRFRVMVEVDERDIALVTLGQSGSLALSALPWDSLPLRVARISPMAKAVDGRNVFEVEAELLAQDAQLRPGLQGSAHITVGHRPVLLSWTRRLVAGARMGWWSWWG